MTAKRAKTSRPAADDAEASAARPAPRKTSRAKTASGAAVRGKTVSGKKTPEKRVPGKTAAKKQPSGKRAGAEGAPKIAARGARAAAPGAARSHPKKNGTPEVVLVVENALDEMKAVNVKRLNVQGLTDITDTMIIASGNSDRHVRSIADRVVERAKSAGFRPMGVEGERDGEWVLVDLQDVIVHVMLPRVREFYRLESLWDVSAARREAAGQSA